MKHRPFPEFCDRCDRKIDDKTGWGVMMICSIQPQPAVDDKNRPTMGLQMCGYCFHELAGWLYPDVDNEDDAA